MCVGSANTDLVAFMSRLPSVGETVAGTSFQVFFGGKGANQAVAAALLAASSSSVAMVGALGDDSFGRDYLAHLDQVGIRTEHVRVHPGVASGVAPIWVDSHGNNSIVVIPGAHALIEADHVTSALSDPTLAGARGLLCQLEIPHPATAAALAAGRGRGMITFLTPAPVPEGGLPAGLLGSVDVLLPNAGEAERLAAQGTTPPAAEATDGGAGGGHPLVRAFAATRALLASTGVPAVVMTLGAHGSLVATAADGAVTYVRSVALKASEVIDTTGAGDCFAGSLAYFYTSAVRERAGGISHACLVSAARRASFVAARSVTRKGAQASYSTRAELPAALFDGSREADADGFLPEALSLRDANDAAGVQI